MKDYYEELWEWLSPIQRTLLIYPKWADRQKPFIKFLAVYDKIPGLLKKEFRAAVPFDDVTGSLVIRCAQCKRHGLEIYMTRLKDAAGEGKRANNAFYCPDCLPQRSATEPLRAGDIVTVRQGRDNPDIGIVSERILGTKILKIRFYPFRHPTDEPFERVYVYERKTWWLDPAQFTSPDVSLGRRGWRDCEVFEDPQELMADIHRAKEEQAESFHQQRKYHAQIALARAWRFGEATYIKEIPREPTSSKPEAPEDQGYLFGSFQLE